MKKSEKKAIIIALIGIIIIGGIAIIKNRNENKLGEGENNQESTNEEKYIEVLEDGTKLNKSEKLSKNIKLDELEIEEFQLTHNNGVSVLLATVINQGNKDIGLTPVEIILYDDQNNEIEKVEGLISPVKVGEKVQLNIGVSKDCANAYDISIRKK